MKLVVLKLIFDSKDFLFQDDHEGDQAEKSLSTSKLLDKLLFPNML